MESDLIGNQLGDDGLFVGEGSEGEDPPAVVLLARHEGRGSREQRLRNCDDAGEQRCAEKVSARED